jgi:exodeoxyribonuclease V beta subunit
LSSKVVAAEIRSRMERGEKAGDIAVLVRTNVEAGTMRERLACLGIPSVLHAVGSVYHSREAQELALVLGAVAEPGNAALARGALCTVILRADSALFEQHAEDQSVLTSFQERLHEYHRLWAEKGFVQMIQGLMVRERVRSRLLAIPGGERSVTNLLQLTELLHAECGAGSLGMGGLMKHLLTRMEDEETAADEHQLRLESDRFAVTIMTVHRSKGLEFPVVFCPFLFCGSREPKEPPLIFHEPGTGLLTMDVGSEDIAISRAAALRETLAEDLRLLYVALTRARQRCTFAWGAVKGAWRSALAYLLMPEIDPGTDIEPLRLAFDRLSAADLLGRLRAIEERSGGCIEIVPTCDAPDPVASAPARPHGRRSPAGASTAR